MSGIAFVHNTQKRLFGVNQPPTKGQHGAQVTAPLLKLIPGINKVDADHWKQAKEQKMVGMLITEGHLVEMGSADDFRALAPDEATALIKGINDKKTLEEWLKVDKRKAVAKALSDRLEALDEQEPGTVRPEKVTGGGKGDNKQTGDRA